MILVELQKELKKCKSTNVCSLKLYVQSSQNKTKYFRFHLSFEVGLRQAREIWKRTERRKEDEELSAL